MSAAVVIGIGNIYRRDDGVGPAVAAALTGTPGVEVVTCPAEPTAILDAWTGSGLAVVVDAAVGGPPGRVRATTLDDATGTDPTGTGAAAPPVSSHDLSLRQTHQLARLLDRAPESVVLVTVDVGDTGHGVGLSVAVAAALPEAVRVVRRVLARQAVTSGHRQP